MAGRMQDRFDRAIEEADRAFWVAVARAFPEARSGDFGVLATMAFDAAERAAVKEWVYLNVPTATGQREDR